MNSAVSKREQFSSEDRSRDAEVFSLRMVDAANEGVLRHEDAEFLRLLYSLADGDTLADLDRIGRLVGGITPDVREAKRTAERNPAGHSPAIPAPIRLDADRAQKRFSLRDEDLARFHIYVTQVQAPRRTS